MIKLTNKYTGQTKHVPTGFSWTYLFFGVLVNVARGDVKNLLIGLLVWLVLAPLTGGIVGIIYWVYLIFNYNAMYIDQLKQAGWTDEDL